MIRACPVAEVGASMCHIQIDRASAASIRQDALQHAHRASRWWQTESELDLKTETIRMRWHGTLSVLTVCSALVLAIAATQGTLVDHVRHVDCWSPVHVAGAPQLLQCSDGSRNCSLTFTPVRQPPSAAANGLQSHRPTRLQDT